MRSNKKKCDQQTNRVFSAVQANNHLCSNITNKANFDYLYMTLNGGMQSEFPIHISIYKDNSEKDACACSVEGDTDLYRPICCFYYLQIQKCHMSPSMCLSQNLHNQITPPSSITFTPPITPTKSPSVNKTFTTSPTTIVLGGFTPYSSAKSAILSIVPTTVL